MSERRHAGRGTSRASGPDRVRTAALAAALAAAGAGVWADAAGAQERERAGGEGEAYVVEVDSVPLASIWLAPEVGGPGGGGIAPFRAPVDFLRPLVYHGAGARAAVRAMLFEGDSLRADTAAIRRPPRCRLDAGSSVVRGVIYCLGPRSVPPGRRLLPGAEVDVQEVAYPYRVGGRYGGLVFEIWYRSREGGR